MNQPAQELMCEKENLNEPESMPVEDLIALLQEHPGSTVRVYASMGYAVLAVEPPADQRADPAPLAPTEAHIPALTAAIHAEGYRIMVDTETGEVKLEPSGDLLTIKEKADLYDDAASAAQDGPI